MTIQDWKIEQKDINYIKYKVRKWNVNQQDIEEIVQDAFIKCYELKKENWNKKKFISVWQNCCYFISKYKNNKESLKKWKTIDGVRKVTYKKNIYVENLQDCGYFSQTEKIIYNKQMTNIVKNIMPKIMSPKRIMIYFNHHYYDVPVEQLHKEFPDNTLSSIKKYIGSNKNIDSLRSYLKRKNHDCNFNTNETLIYQFRNGEQNAY